ncbi:MAG: DUF547 domain-containing protein [Polaromonas sp.]
MTFISRNITRRNAIISGAVCAHIYWIKGVFAQEKPAFDAQYAAWDALLKKHVKWLPDNRQSRVSYAGFAADRTALDAVLATWSAVPQATFNGWSRAEQMAFLINAYNGFTIALVLSRYPQLKSIKDIGSLVQSAWKKKFFTLLGEQRHLDWIEHEQLRPRYGDWRLHAAMVCASIGCPALRPEAYTAARLGAQLDDGFSRFMADRTRNRLADGKLQVSAIFKWFKEDFQKDYPGGSGIKQQSDVFAKYADLLADAPADREKIRAGSVEISYLDYDWLLNDAGR